MIGWGFVPVAPKEEATPAEVLRALMAANADRMQVVLTRAELAAEAVRE